MRTGLILMLAVLVLALPTPLVACLWDNDTIAMERERFPEAHEMIAGMFVRHAPVYYQWRIEDRQSTPIEQRTPADYDDIAVAYDKLGQSDDAIATIRAKMQRWPSEGRYESEANLGTFYIHAGDFEQGLIHIEKAIQINPEAHFGREVYQKLLVEYVLAVRAADGDDALPLRKDPGLAYSIGAEPEEPAEERPAYLSTFPAFVLYMRATPRSEQDAELGRAVQGVLGMMRFGNPDSPILLEALGDLMLAGSFEGDAKMLASRAYLKAYYETDDADASAAYRVLAERAVAEQEHVELARVEADLKQEIAQGEAFFAQIEADETAWAQAGKDLDAEFAAKYYQAPVLAVQEPVKRLAPWFGLNFGSIALVGVALLVGVLLVAGLIYLLRHGPAYRSAV